MIFPVKHKNVISVMYGSVTVFPRLAHKHLFTESQGRDCANIFTLCLTCRAAQTQSIRLPLVTRLPYPGSRQATSCPGTATPCCEGTESRPGADCCSAPGASEASAKEAHVRLLFYSVVKSHLEDHESMLWLLNI